MAVFCWVSLRPTVCLGGSINVSVFPEGQLGGSGELGVYAVGEVCECQYPETYYVDNDGDGFGTEAVLLCEPGPGYASRKEVTAMTTQPLLFPAILWTSSGTESTGIVTVRSRAIAT